MPLSAANAIQAKTGQITSPAGGPAQVVLDGGTTAGSTVTLELSSNAVSFTDGAFGTRVPNGWELDAVAPGVGGIKNLWVFRKREVAAEEGVAGSTSWDFDAGGLALIWSWRVTEWDLGLEPISPLEAVAANSDGGAAVTSLSTGTSTSTSRSDLVLLTFHYWTQINGTNPTFSFSSYTPSSFVKRDELFWVSGSNYYDSAWGWRFVNAAGAYECTANITNSSPQAGDAFSALLVGYAATTYA